MSIDYEAAFANITPHHLANSLGLEIKEKDGSSFIKNPKTNSPVQLTETEFISQDPVSSFRAGNVVDFYKYIKSCSYTEAMVYIYEEHGNLLTNANVYTKGIYIPMMSSYLEGQAAVYDSVFALTKNLNNRDDQDDQFRTQHNFFKRKDIDLQFMRNSVFLATKAQLLDIIDLVAPADDIELYDDTYILMPYFSSYGRIAYIYYYSIHGDRGATLTVNKCKISYFGLHNVPPLAQNIVLYSDPYDTMRDYFRNREKMRNKFCVTVRISRSVEYPGVLFKTATYAYREKDSLSNISTYLCFCDALQVFSSRTGETTDWEQFLASHMCQLSATGVDNVIKEVNITPLLLSRLIVCLLDMERPDLVKTLEAAQNKYQVYTSKGISIEARPEGYVAIKPGKATIEQQFTNFTVTIEKIVLFDAEDSQGLPIRTTHYCGTVRSGDDRCPLTLQDKHINNAAAIVTEVAAASREFKFELYPSMLDKTYNSHLINVINSSRATAPRMRGIGLLGWSSGRTSFTTPEFEISATRIRAHNSATPNVDNKPFDVYLFNEPQVRGAIKAKPMVNGDTITLLGIMAGFLVRSYLDLPMPVVPIRNTSRARNMLLYVLGAIGQTEPIIFRGKKRKNHVGPILSGLYGMPIYGFVRHEANIIKDVSDTAMYILSDAGIRIHTHLTPSEYWGVADQTAEILQKVCQCLLKQRGMDIDHDLVFSEDKLTVPALIELGLCAINPVLGTDWRLTGVLYNTMAHFLYSLEDPISVFHLDLKKQRIRMSYRDTSFTRKELRPAALSIDPTAEIEEPFYIWFNPDTIQPYLKTLLNIEDLDIKPLQAKEEGEKVEPISPSKKAPQSGT